MLFINNYAYRRLYLKAIVFFFILFMTISFTKAQISNPYFVRINTSSGLPSDNIHSSLQDKRGLIWLSTKNGLSYYDGSKMSILVYHPNKKNPVVDFTAFIQDQSGVFWLGSYGGLLINYNHTNREFSSVDGINITPKSNPITLLYEDNEGFIWIGNNTNKLWRLNKISGNVTVVEIKKENNSEKNRIKINDICEDNTDNLWIATNNGFYKYEKQSRTITSYYREPNNSSSLVDNKVNCLLSDKDNFLWIGTDKGLERFNDKNLEFVHFNTHTEGVNLLSGDKITDLFIDSHQQLWVGTNKGLNLKRNDRKGFQFFQYKEYQDNSIPSNYITNINEDNAGHLWVTTQNGGAALLDLNPKSINNTKLVEQINGLITTEITSLYYDTKSNSLWIGTESEGIFHFLLHNGAYPYAYYNNESNQLEYNGIKDLFIDSNGYLWIIYKNNSFAIKQEKRNKLVSVFPQDAYQFINNKTVLKFVFQDADNNLWLGLSDTVIVVSIKDGKKIREFKHKELFPNLEESLEITSITQDYRRNIWFGSSAFGISVVNLSTNIRNRFISNPTEANTLSSNRIQCFFEDYKGVMWIGTADGGLNKFNRINFNFERIDKTNGLASNNVQSLIEDSEDNLWIGTSAGLNSMNQSTNTIALFDKMDGLKSNAFVRNAVSIGKYGDLYFATQRGFNAFNHSSYHTNKCGFNLIFSDFIINSVSIFKQEEKDQLQAFLNAYPILLKPTQSNISIEFSALEFLNPNNVNYYYKLEGVDQDWVDSKNNNFVSYINLAPGSYTFHIKASNKAGNFTPNTASLQFVIATPLIKRVWFIAMITVILLILIIAFIRLRINRVRKQNILLEEQVELKTREIVDSNLQLQKEVDERIRAEANAERASRSKSQFLANMSHEIRTPMNAIIGFTDLLASLVKEEKQRYYLNSIRSSGKSLLVLINDILDLSKIEAGHFHIDYRPISLINLFEEIKQVFALKCDEKDLDFVLYMDEKIPPSLIMSEIRLRQILVNLIGNALKFTEKGRIGLSARVIADAIKENKINLLIEVSDTGIGIEADQQERIFQAFHQTEGQDVRKYGGTGLGLSISKRLIELMGGKLEVKSEYGKGSTFQIYLNNVEISEEDVVQTDEPSFTVANKLHFKPAQLMVVDDSQTNRSLIIELFSDTEITVIEAGNGQVAVEKAINLLPDLILMDIRMPVLDGYEAVKLIRADKLSKNIPVIALTASISDENKDKYTDSGFNAVLLKPLDIEVLLQEVSKYLPFDRLDKELQVEKEAENLIESLEASKPNLNKLQIAIVDLKELIPVQEKLKKQKFVNDILLFAKQIGAVGTKYKISYISKYADDLVFYTENFDTEKMEKSINNFPNLILELEQYLKK